MEKFLRRWYGKFGGVVIALGVASIYLLWGDPNSPQVFWAVATAFAVLGIGLAAAGFTQRLRASPANS